MISRPDFLIIGSTGRNTGKTEFACRLIKQYSKDYNIVGVKVTAIDRNEGKCPRGKDSCGVCDELCEEFDISLEKDPLSDKDTARMLGAGAKEVYWMKVDKNAMKNGLKTLLKKIPKNALVVCESNSLRADLEPGLFIVMKNLQEKAFKGSCSRVIGYADKIIEFGNMNWDFPPDRILIKNGQWIIREKATAVVLAGGKSSRMGGIEKSLLPVNGEPLISIITKQLDQHFDEIIIGANDAEKFKFLGLRVIPDIEKDKGPLMGILSCLKASASDVNFITACDIPVMNIKLIQRMIGFAGEADIIMPLAKKDKHEPLFAVYKKNMIEPAEIILNNNGRRIIELFKYAKVRFVEFNESGWYKNLNERDDYVRFVEKNEFRECYKDNGTPETK